VTALDPGDIDRQAVESRRRQGLPDYVEDPATIARVVRLILAGRPPSGPPDDLDARGVKDVATLQAGVQDHPFDHRRQDRTAPAQPPDLPSLLQCPLPQRQGGKRPRSCLARQMPPGRVHARLDPRPGPSEVGPAQGAVSEGVDQLVQAVLVDLQGGQQLSLGLVLPGRRGQRRRQRGAAGWRTTHSETSCSTGSARRPVLPQPPKFRPDAHT
jgi:hypothetical protein